MKKLTNKFFVLIFTGLLLSACNNAGSKQNGTGDGPGNEGKQAGVSFCNCMTGKIIEGKSPSILSSEKDSCESEALKLLKQAEAKYTTDASRLSEVDMAYNNATQKTCSDYNAAISRAINNIFSKSVWVKEGETGPDNYLFSFAADNITPLNEKGEYVFSLNGDTINITDDKKTRLIMHFDTEQKFSLSNLDKSSTAHYHLASNHEKLIGYWSSNRNFVFKPDNSFLMELWDHSYSSEKYSWNGDEITLNDMEYGNQIISRGKLLVTDINQITLPLNKWYDNISHTFTRSKQNKTLNVTSLYR